MKLRIAAMAPELLLTPAQSTSIIKYQAQGDSETADHFHPKGKPAGTV